MKLQTRRDILKQGGLLATLLSCGLISLKEAQAASVDQAFAAKTFEDALKAIGGTPATSTEVSITTPDIAENGAVVPVSITSNLPKTQEIYVLIEKNPNPLAAVFTIPEGTDAFVSTRTKMGQSTNVMALVKADGKLYSAVKETKVTLGGCGG
jgi:sulfur-oxidizing protein SoxY